MSLHKLTAGDGYTYLTRQVAAHDEQAPGRDGLAAYYAEKGESPGVWLGAAATGRDGFPAVGEVVGEQQMVALFGEGRHPNAEQIEAELLGAGHLVRTVLAATQLGRPYRAESPESAFRSRLAAGIAASNAAAGRSPGASMPEAERARVRTGLVREMFAEEHGREAVDARELASFATRVSRPPAGPVAGDDLTFTPVKSVSALWAVAPHEVADAVEQAHSDAVRDALGWLERHAVFTRLGTGGVRQVEVTGLLAVAFTHRDSRAGDPNLHTHVAVSNKVQVADTAAGGGQAGQWRALDGRPLHALAVAASERYNTRLAALLVDRLGVQFADRPGPSAGKRAVREIVGVDERLNRWSARRASIDVRRAELAAAFLGEHGRPPSPVEAVKLAQQATLETRQGKHAPRLHADQRTTWRQQAVAVLGGRQGLDAMLADVQQAAAEAPSRPAQATAAWVADTAQIVLDTVQTSRATWQQAHVRAEVERRVRAAAVPLALVDEAVDRVAAAALSPALSLPLGPADTFVEPRALRRSDGTSVFTRTGSQLFTSAQVLAAERILVELGGRCDGRSADAESVDWALQDAAAQGLALNPGQADLVRELATSGAQVQLVLAPAGAGKTTALTALTRAWTTSGGQVLGLTPSAAAASVLGHALAASGTGPRVPADTLAKLLWSLDQLDPASDAARDQAGGARGRVPAWVHAVGPQTLVLIDEAGMAGTADLARAVQWVVGRGGSVRLVGDDAQLAAVGAGGVLRDLTHTHGVIRLHQVARFADPAEAAASLALREGDPSSLGFYLDNQRVNVGYPATAADQAYAAWQADRVNGRDSLLLAATRDTVTALNIRARADRLAALPPAGQTGRKVALADGTRASAGDTILTRRNDRRLAITGTDWVKNGDRLTVQDVLPGGALRVMHTATGRRLVLPAAYVAEHVQLGYATTVHTAQGRTADTSDTVLTGTEDRQLLYVAASRGRAANSLLPANRRGRRPARAGPAGQCPAADRRRTAHPHPRPRRRADLRHQHPMPARRPRRAARRRGRPLPQQPHRRRDQGLPTRRPRRRRRLPLDDDPSARRTGPLPWLPPIPAALAAHPVWGGYLTDRAQHVQDLARHTAEVAGGWTMSTAPAWATPLLGAAGQDDCQLVARLAVWRAAHRVPGSDPRPTGPPLPHGPLTIGQQALDDAVDRVLVAAPSTTSRYGDLAALEPRLATEPGWAQLITRLDATPETVDLAPSPFRPSGTARCPTSCPRQRRGGDSRAPCPPSRASRSSPHR